MTVAWRFRAAPTGENEPERLVRAAVRGDQDATRALLTALLPRVRNVVRYLVRRDSDTDDAAQEALIAVLRGLPSYRGDGALVSWVDRVTAREVFKHLRRTQRPSEPVLVEVSSLAGPASAVPDQYMARRLAVAILDTLPEEQRHAVVLHHVLEMTVPEIADELHISRETVRSRLRLARERLRAWRIEVDSEDRADAPPSAAHREAP